MPSLFFKLLGLILAVISYTSLVAQQQTITGKIVDSKSNAPLFGVSVKLKGSAKGTVTNAEGVFTIQAQPGDVLEVSMVGYTLQSVPVNSQSPMTIQMEASSNELTQIVLVGTRRAGRIKTETPVPVDVVNLGQVALPTARTDITSLINYSAPSFNYTKQSGSDGADHIDLATLRGLGPDQTLVLINGKRRHQTAFVAVFGARGRGNSGTDLSAIPVSAIERVEILRDGASAQYGSDAIAGVINLVLKSTVKQFSANIGYSGYYDKKYNPYFKRDYDEYVYHGPIDGNSLTANINYGLPIGKKGGFINLTGSLTTMGKTFRQALDTNQKSYDFMYTDIYRRAHGDAALKTFSGFFNSEIPLAGNTTTFYAFGGYNYKSSDAYAFTRNFSARPDRFPTDNNGNLIEVPDIIKTAKDGEKYFNPHIQTLITDASVAAGVKGQTGSNWLWDVSNTIGTNNFHFYGDKTFNASKGATQTHFDDGGFNFLQNTVNVNFSKQLPNVFSGCNIAFGAEYRYERYKLFAGEEASYKNYDATGDKASGSQGFPGYQPNDEVNANRSTVGAYIDAEADITNRFLLGLAIRAEHYSDFGFTDNYKLATRYKVADNFNIRGSVSTGFRAPSLQQINFSSTFTTVQGGNIAEVKIAPNYSPITKAAGIPELKQEKSINASLGFAWRPAKDLSVTIDGYWVKIKDRVVLSGQFSVDDPTIDPQLVAAMQQLHVSLAQFFANAVNTTNRGIDIVVEYNKKAGAGNIKALLTGNVQKMDIDKINVPAKLNNTKDLQSTFLSEREQKFILASAPNSKFGLNLEYGLRKFTVGTRFTYFGKMVIMGYGDGTASGFNPPFDRGDLYAYVPADSDGRPVKDQYNYYGKLVSDLYFSYRLTKAVTAFIGADNIFNVHPDLGINREARAWAFNNETGGPWDAVQMGGNGIRLFAKIGVNF
jgi:iron complex outermembrane receptor protein